MRDEVVGHPVLADVRAIFGAVFGAIILVAVLVMTGTTGKNGWFRWIWLAAGLFIIALNLWAAFSRNGSLQTISQPR